MFDAQTMPVYSPDPQWQDGGEYPQLVHSTAIFGPGFGPTRAETWYTRWNIIDHFCFAVFVIDFLMRMWAEACLGHLKRFLVPSLATGGLMNWVDVIAIVPFYVTFFMEIGGSGNDSNEQNGTTALRVLRMTRVTTALKSLKSVGDIGNVVTIIFKTSFAPMAIPLFFMLLAMIVFGCIIYYVESAGCSFAWFDGEPTQRDYMFFEPKIWPLGLPVYKVCMPGTGGKDGPLCIEDIENVDNYDCETFTSIPTTFWYCLVTFTTTGYGDQVPSTNFGLLIGAFVMMIGVFFMAMPVAIIGSSFQAAYQSIVKKREALRHAEHLASGSYYADVEALKRKHCDIDAHLRLLFEKIDRFSAPRSEGERVQLDKALVLISFLRSESKRIFSAFPTEEEAHAAIDFELAETTSGQSTLSAAERQNLRKVQSDGKAKKESKLTKFRSPRKSEKERKSTDFDVGIEFSVNMNDEVSMENPFYGDGMDIPRTSPRDPAAAAAGQSAASDDFADSAPPFVE